MMVQGQARTGEVPGRGGPGVMSGKTPGVRETPPAGPGELQQTPQEIEGPYFRLGAPQRSNLLEPGDKPASASAPSATSACTWAIDLPGILRSGCS